MTPSGEPPLTTPEGGVAPAAGPPRPSRPYGVLAEFSSPQRLLDALHAARAAGYRHIDAFTPFPIEEINELVCPRPSKVPIIVFIGGVLGCLTGYLLQTYSAVIDYPVNVGGRPLHSWPMFVPITFELTILFSGLAAVFGMFALNGLPMPYHPVFNSPRFALASRDRYFMAIEATDPGFDPVETRAFLSRAGADEVTDVSR